jgi:hypothetical protein
MHLLQNLKENNLIHGPIAAATCWCILLVHYDSTQGTWNGPGRHGHAWHRVVLCLVAVSRVDIQLWAQNFETGYLKCETLIFFGNLKSYLICIIHSCNLQYIADITHNWAWFLILISKIWNCLTYRSTYCLIYQNWRGTLLRHCRLALAAGCSAPLCCSLCSQSCEGIPAV